MFLVFYSAAFVLSQYADEWLPVAGERRGGGEGGPVDLSHQRHE